MFEEFDSEWDNLSVNERYDVLCKKREMDARGEYRMTKEEQYVLREFERHGNKKWLTDEDAKYYEERGKKILEVEMIASRKSLCTEMEEEYGVTELEALNITNGYNVKYYVNKYYMISHLVFTKKKIEKKIRVTEERYE